MHYRRLIEGDRIYHKIEHRQIYYDRYMADKNWASWSNPDISLEEIQKLFYFIKKWDRFFQGDIDEFKTIFKEVYPSLEKINIEKIENTAFTKEFMDEIRRVFDKVANCPGGHRYESTDASKILHTISPNFFVMWDDKIKENTVDGGQLGSVYAIKFLPKMQSEIIEAIETCMSERKLEREKAIKYIYDQCKSKTLTKLVDQYNYVQYTKGVSIPYC